jgi:hypothetical protein
MEAQELFWSFAEKGILFLGMALVIWWLTKERQKYEKIINDQRAFLIREHAEAKDALKQEQEYNRSRDIELMETFEKTNTLLAKLVVLHHDGQNDLVREIKAIGKDLKTHIDLSMNTIRSHMATPNLKSNE